MHACMDRERERERDNNNLIISIAQKTCEMIYCALHQCLYTTKFILKNY